jgi:peroxiredoxin
MTTVIYDDSASEVSVAQTSGEQCWLPAAALQAATGWEIKPEGICRDEICVTVKNRPALVRSGPAGQELDLAGFAHLIGQPYARESTPDVWYFGPSLDQRRSALVNLQAPDFTLPDLAGTAHSLSAQHGKKVVLALWASWWGCRFDLPVWQALREELKGENVEVITVACDSKGAETAREWIVAAHPSHPALIDADHHVPALYNTRNVPAVFWIAESGVVVRGNDPVYLMRRNRETGESAVNEKYLHAVRDWVARGAASIYVTPAAETQRRMGEPDEPDSQALAEFRLGLYLHRAGHADAAIEHFKKAHALKPDNWNYKRQAWNLGDIERDYGTTIQAALTGPVPFYPPLELPERD